MRLITALAALTLVSFTACQRDFSLPPPAGAAQGTISGRVVAVEAQTQSLLLVEGARVSSSGGATTFSGSDGMFTLAGLPLGRHGLLIEWDRDGDGVFDRQRLLDEVLLQQAGQDAFLGDLQLEAPGSVSGTVSLADGGSPAGTVVYVSGTALSAITTGDGSFLIRGVPTGTVSIESWRAGYSAAELEHVPVRSALLTREVDFKLEVDPAAGSLATVSGRVRAADALDAVGFTVRLRAAETGDPVAQLTAQADGSYSFADLPLGLYRLEAELEGYPPAFLIPLVVDSVSVKAPELTLVRQSADDLDGDGVLNADDTDRDGDGTPDATDAFPDNPRESADLDGDGLGDRSDPDPDGDHLSSAEELVPGLDGWTTDPQRADTDGDGVDDGLDLCPTVIDPAQADADSDGIGDACAACLGNEARCGTITVSVDGNTAVSVPTADGRGVLEIPVGSVTSPVEITATLKGGTAGFETSYEMGPSGLVFATPATFTLQLTPAELPSGAALTEVSLAYVKAGGRMEPIAGSSVDPQSGRLTAPIKHFSVIRAVVTPPSALPPVAVIVPASSTGVGSTILIDGSGSYDPSGLPIAYNWVLLQRPSLSVAEIQDSATPIGRLTPDQPGAYRLGLAVTNGQQGSALALLVVQGTMSCQDGENRACYDGPAGTETVGQCVAGAQSCSAGVWGPCDAVKPAPEQCDGVDNDCDGLADEGLACGCNSGDARACGLSLGRCARGTQSCLAGGQWGACLGAVEPAVERCDGADNDCDGQVDEGLSIGCFSGPYGSLGVGICRAGIQSCGSSACLGEVLPMPEICDGLDNDCDGELDEGCGACSAGDSRACYDGPAASEGVGRCVGGTQSCDAGGAWGPCLGQKTPAAEQCDGADNDCDGVPDNGFDLSSDLANCGACGNVCQLPNGSAACQAGACTLTACAPGFADADRNPLNGCESTCLPSNGGVEVCDNLDNNCDGQVDEGFDGDGDGFSSCNGDCADTDPARSPLAFELCDAIDNNCDGATDEAFDLQTDPTNCGGCNLPCVYPGAIGSCAGGSCQIAGCAFGWWDLDGQTSNGCEYRCIPSIGGTETCNGRDDNCDGQIDEGIDLLTDLNNCGGCGLSCSANNGTAACTLGWCQVSGCNPGYADADHNPYNGCEYQCTPSNGGVEICDTQDNDCDGLVDNGFDLQRDTNNCGVCGKACPNTSTTESMCQGGQCQPEMCRFNFVDLNADLGTPSSDGCECVDRGFELCNGQDDNCDGLVDEGFDFQNDPLNCGGCGNRCFFVNASATCSAGFCQMTGCNLGWTDGDLNPFNGCEYACLPSNGGVEICDGLDNNCDGAVDEFFDMDGDGYTTCSTPNADCDDNDPGSYPGAFERCDGKVNNCGTPLPANEIDGDGDGVLPCFGDCDDTDPTKHPGAPELCNGLDDNCDLQVPPIEGDLDGDGFFACAGDCNDSNNQVYPGAAELCDGIDNDCDSVVPKGEFDADGDGVMVCAGDCDDSCPTCFPGSTEVCDGKDNDCLGGIPAGELDVDGDGYSGCQGDCNDGDVLIYPGAFERCNGVDDDCDTIVPADEADVDKDGYRICGGDCNDNCVTCFPGALETCDNLDNNCDFIVDEGFDQDGDGYTTCSLPIADCDDTIAERHPGAVEMCDNFDTDCVGGKSSGEVDADGDGVMICEGDCDDGNINVSPYSSEIPGNGIDDNCDGFSPTAGCLDQDADQFYSAACGGGDCNDTAGVGGNVHPNGQFDIEREFMTCSPGPAQNIDCTASLINCFALDADSDGWFAIAEGGHDCDDTRNTVNPSHFEDCGDALDNDCDGLTDENCP